MKLWKISQSVNTGYDTFDSAVVAADTEEQAKRMYPSDGSDITVSDCAWSWTSDPNNVECEYIGEAKVGLREGVICSSYNAG